MTNFPPSGQPPQPEGWGPPPAPPSPGAFVPPPTGPAPQPAPQPYPQAPMVPVAPAPAAGMTNDPSTLAAMGLIAAVLFAVVAGLFGFLAGTSGLGFRVRLLRLTDTSDVGDVALLGIAVALMVLTPDPPGGLSRTLLLKVDAALAAIIALYGVIRALTIISTSDSGGALLRFAGFVSTVGVALAAATVAFYAAKESFLKTAP